MANRKATAATVPATVAAPATPAARPVPAHAHKYGAAHRTVANRATSYTLTALGKQVAAQGTGKGGKPTVMALVAQAAAIATQGGTMPATGVAIVAAMLRNASIVAALRATKATKYVPGTANPCPAWCAGYVTGAARAAHGLLATA